MKIWPGKLEYLFFIAKKQSNSLSLKYLDMLLHALKVLHIMVTFEMFKWYKLLHYKEKSAIYWMALVYWLLKLWLFVVIFTKHGTLMRIEYVVLMWL